MANYLNQTYGEAGPRFLEPSPFGQSMLGAAKLTLKEFAPAFNYCKPPTGWGKKIAIAYSGGVDSTCLLYLVDNLIKETTTLKDLSIVAIHVDHRFRSGSHKDVEHCQKWTDQRSIPFTSYRIPWNEPPFNTLPITDRNREEMGRIARYHAIFNAMKEENAGVLLMAHHMDDQVETALMRQHRRKEETGGTTLLGMAGMRHCRRWGMGNYPINQMRYFGYEGMSRWICRPLLDYPKERLIATVNEESLEFVEDESNKDASLTERNAIRADVAKMGHELLLARPTNPLRPVESLPKELELPAADVVREYALLRDDVDHAVDEYLRTNRHFSPEGTLHLITSKGPPPPRIVQYGVILRILRYVSPFPWGSPHAEAARSSEKLSRIAAKLWPYADVNEMHVYRSHGLFTSRTKFCGGSEVLWNPTPTSSLSTPLNISQSGVSKGVEKTYGWLAQRQPPPSHLSAVVDITRKIQEREPFTVLWDSRWLCSFSENAIDAIRSTNFIPSSTMSSAGSRIAIAPRDQWWTPSISYNPGSRYDKPGLYPLVLPQNNPPVVSMTFIRTIDAI